jgi:hypothetical protein
MNIDGNLLGIAWVTVTFVAWTAVFVDSLTNWHKYRDTRSWRELSTDLALMFAAWAAGLSLGAYLLRDIVDIGPGLRAVLAGVAWSMFAAAGLLRVIDDSTQRRRRKK